MIVTEIYLNGFNQKQNRRTLMSKLIFFIIFIGIVIVGIGTTD